MHQPLYVDPTRARATLPWTRLHSLKHYLDLPAIARLIQKGRGFSREDLAGLLAIQQAFLGEVLPEYASAAAEGAIEISASPYFHPILPLLCDTGVAHEATPRLPLPGAVFRHP